MFLIISNKWTVASTQIEQHKTLRDTKAAVDAIGSGQRAKNFKEWLRPSEPSDNANRAKDLRYPGTGTWFLNSPEFKFWLKGYYRHLCVYGPVGCGKTVLTSTILDFLRKTQKGVVLYFFFDFNDIYKRTFNGLLRSLLFQLYSLEEVCAQKLDALRKSHKDGKFAPSTDALLDGLQDSLRAVEEAFILMDALDECKEDQQQE